MFSCTTTPCSNDCERSLAFKAGREMAAISLLWNSYTLFLRMVARLPQDSVRPDRPECSISRVRMRNSR